MNSARFGHISVSHRLRMVISAIVSSCFVLALAVALAPLAYWQLGLHGLSTVVIAAAAIVAAIFASNWSEFYGPASGYPIFGSLFAMCVRLLVPLIVVLFVVMGSNPQRPAWSAVYIVPMYLVMLASETVFAIRRARAASGGSPARTNQRSSARAPSGARSTHGI